MYSPHRLRSGLFLLAIAALAPFPASAQAQRRATPNDTLKSTEVADDHKVTFRIYAPKASEVSVSGDFGQGGKMEKDDQGVWSRTVGPLAPDFYSYTFNVDGVRTMDPKNPMTKPGLNSLDSLFLVPGEEAEFEMTKDVPHGDVRAVWYRSGTLDMPRRMHVYTPPGLRGRRRRYPVFYLLHGGGDEDSGWSTIGRAGFILDNLIAAKKAVPMLVVMPNGSLPRPANLPPRRQRPAPPVARGPRPRGSRPESVHRRVAEGGRPDDREDLPREGRALRSGARRAVDGRRADPEGPDHEPGPIRLRGDLERGPFRRQCRGVGEAE